MAYSKPIENFVNKDKKISTQKSNGQLQTKGVISSDEEVLELSGPNWIRDGSNNEFSARYYDLDLTNKYHKDSRLKQFHTVTFYFQNSSEKNKQEKDKDPNKTIFIRCQLPEKISYAIGGEWGAPTKIPSNKIINALLGGAGGSTVYGLDTTKIWTNPKPLSVRLSIPVFDDVEDESHMNFQEALDVFGRAVLPEMSEHSMYTSTPGPAFTTALANRQDGKHVTGTNIVDKASTLVAKTANATSELLTNTKIAEGKDLDRITVQIGGMLLIDWAIITDVQVTYPNTKSQILHQWKTARKMQLLPQVAQLDIQIETVTGLTRTAYRNMLNLTTGEQNNKSEKVKSIFDSSYQKVANTVKAVNILEQNAAYGTDVQLTGQGGMSYMNGSVYDGNGNVIPGDRSLVPAEQNSSPVPKGLLG